MRFPSLLIQIALMGGVGSAPMITKYTETETNLQSTGFISIYEFVLVQLGFGHMCTIMKHTYIYILIYIYSYI